ncbi:MAG TPA: BatD family protein [Gammaproteobacteria bacterium]|nr:BatD family protein [Gammaproteobacteria bacterium]
MPGLLYAAVTATLDRDAIYAGDTVTLRITTTGDDEGKQPDLTPLQKDFEVLGTSSSSQIRIINGQRSDKHEWLVELAPLASGTRTIPALSVGNSKTSALTLEVSEQPAAATAQAGQPVFIRSEISPSQGDTYVQQQILYTTRLYYRVPLIEGSFTNPKPENAVVEQLSEDRQYNTTIDGQSYQVVERRYAIFPERSGQLTIAPTVFSGRAVSETGQRSPFGRMDSMIEQMLGRGGFNDRFFAGTPFGDPGKRVRLASNTLTLDIKPHPDGYDGTHWLPTQNLVLQDSWASAPPVFHAGEPVTRTLTLEAKGLEASQLPNIQMEGSDTLRVYAEQPELTNRTDGDWVYGRSEQRFTYIPSQPGELHFPAVQISWWDSVNHRQQSSELPAWDVMVEPGIGSTASATASGDPATAPASAAAQPNNNRTTGTPAPAPSTSTDTGADHRRYWQVGGALGVALLLVATFLRMRKAWKPEPADLQATQHSVTDVTPQPARTNDNKALTDSRQSLRDACARSDPQAAAGALLDWAAATWPDQPPRSLGALAARVGQGGEHIRDLEAVLYGAGARGWDSQPLWKAFMDGLPGPVARTATGHQTEGVPPLYPDWHKQAG